jgi:hypothetical protein
MAQTVTQTTTSRSVDEISEVSLEAGAMVAGRYRLERELGRGGFAVTWQARDQTTGAAVAVKVLSLRSIDHWKAIELFEREARVLHNLGHPQIPKYLDFIAPATSLRATRPRTRDRRQCCLTTRGATPSTCRLQPPNCVLPRRAGAQGVHSPCGRGAASHGTAARALSTDAAAHSPRAAYPAWSALRPTARPRAALFRMSSARFSSRREHEHPLTRRSTRSPGYLRRAAAHPPRTPPAWPLRPTGLPTTRPC